MEQLLLQIMERLDKMDKRFDDLEKRMKKSEEMMEIGFSSASESLDRIESKLKGIPETYEMHEKIMGRHDRDIELLKKIILNQ